MNFPHLFDWSHASAPWRIAGFVLALLILTPLPVHGADAARSMEPTRGDGPVWATATFSYRAEGKRVGEVLQDFAASQGLPAVVAEGVDGVVHATFNSTPQAFLAAINKAYGVIWYHDGTTLYFYPAKAMQSRLFRLKGFTRTQVQNLLTTLRLGDNRYPLRYNASENTLLVYGPPRHIDVVSAALESLDAGASEHNRMTVRVFQLYYASAADRTMGATFLPGVASTLRSLYGGAPPEGSGGQQRKTSPNLGGKLQALRSTYGSTRLVPEADQHSNDPPSTDRSSTGVAPRGVRSPVNLEDDTPTFEADEGTNSVIVQGRQHRMAEYSYLIRRLDVRPQLVELEAMIIDVSTESVDALGINWSARGGGTRLSVGPSGSTLPTSSTGGSFTMSTLWTNAGREFIARIEAMQTRGQARIVARPKVLGAVNRAAVMQEKRVASVRVAGNLDAQLYRIEAGTLLQVTPQVTNAANSTQVKLSIYIEDGSFEAQVVDTVPIVKRTEIRTEAHMLEGESLLIGGITIDSQSSTESGVPGLSKIPLVGGLFRWDGSRTARSERLFLITPRVLKSIDALPPLGDRQADPVEIPGMPDQSFAPAKPAANASAPATAAAVAPPPSPASTPVDIPLEPGMSLPASTAPAPAKTAAAKKARDAKPAASAKPAARRGVAAAGGTDSFAPPNLKRFNDFAVDNAQF